MKIATVIGVLLALLVAGGAFYWIRGMAAPVADTAQVQQSAPVQSSIGTFSYDCDNGAGMTMTPADDMSAVSIGPNGQMSAGKIPDVTLMAAGNANGARYQGQGVVFVGAGEEVTLTVGTTTVHCNPTPNPDMAPFNWGDAGDGGGSAWPQH